MVLRNVVKANNYADSVFLMSLANRALGLLGVIEASAMMGTPQNRELIRRAGLLTSEGEAARPDDLIIALQAESEEAAQQALDQIEDWLAQRQAPRATEEAGPPRTLSSALERMPEANLVLISLPGQYVRWEAQKAIDRERHVMIFSDNVPIEDEVALKGLAREAGLLVMGPDCGTAILGGKALGFGNVIRRGNIGIVGASGTGIQEVSTLLDQWGLGISQAIGLGSRDLTREVAGAGALQALKILQADAGTGLIAFISKPPDGEVAERIVKVLAQSRKPCVACFQGQRKGPGSSHGVWFSATLEGAAILAATLSHGGEHALEGLAEKARQGFARAQGEWSRLGEGQRYIRGLFSGGSLGAEAGLILLNRLPGLFTNIHLPGASPLEDSSRSQANSLIDLGADEFTVGVPHPMIDLTVRNKRLIQEAEDPQTAVILMDIVLGYGAHPDPAGAVLPAILQGRKLAKKRGGHLCCVVSICGSEGDPQGLERQRQQLEEGGVVVMPTAAQAALFAALVVERGQGTDDIWLPPRIEHLASSADKSAKADESLPLANLFDVPLKVINLGLPSFAQALEDQEVPVVHVDWRPPAGGDPNLLKVLRKLR